MAHVIGVIGPGHGATPENITAAEQVGRLLADGGHQVVNGGLGGVMEAASRGAAAGGGIVVGLLPGTDRSDANPHLTVALPTGLGELRNGLVVSASHAIICIGGSWGTLSELALATRTGIPAVTLQGWDLPEAGPLHATTAQEAVEIALFLASGRDRD